MTTSHKMTEEEAFTLVREYVVSELDAVLAEMRVPLNTGLIAKSKLEHLRAVLTDWPNVTVLGKPVVIGTSPDTP